ncbi:hypothetical protein, partial [Pseudomonas alabamensis]
MHGQDADSENATTRQRLDGIRPGAGRLLLEWEEAGMVRAASCKLQAASCKLQAASCKLQAAS